MRCDDETVVEKRHDVEAGCDEIGGGRERGRKLREHDHPKVSGRS